MIQTVPIPPKVSNRELRRVLRAQIHGQQVIAAAADAQAGQLRDIANNHAAILDALGAILNRGFWGRLRWLLWGS